MVLCQSHGVAMPNTCLLWCMWTLFCRCVLARVVLHTLVHELAYHIGAPPRKGFMFHCAGCGRGFRELSSCILGERWFVCQAVRRSCVSKEHSCVRWVRIGCVGRRSPLWSRRADEGLWSMLGCRGLRMSSTYVPPRSLVLLLPSPAFAVAADAGVAARQPLRGRRRGCRRNWHVYAWRALCATTCVAHTTVMPGPGSRDGQGLILGFGINAPTAMFQRKDSAAKSGMRGGCTESVCRVVGR